MNDPEDRADKPDENSIAYAAVSLFGNKAHGVAPQWHELSSWRAGTLSAERSAQVLSHVANDPDCFQQWLDIVEAEQWVEQETVASADSTVMNRDDVSDSDSLSTPATAAIRTPRDRTPPTDIVTQATSWLRSLLQLPLPVYAGAMAAVILAVLITPLMRQSELSLQQQLDRSLDTYIATDIGLPPTVPTGRDTRNIGDLFDDLSVADVERQYFQQGLRKSAEALGSETVAQWQEWTAQLPIESVDCSKALDATHCQRVSEDFNVLGQWSLVAYAACQPSAAEAIANIETFWSAQYELYDEVRERSDIAKSTLFAPLLQILDDRTPAALCARIDSLMTAGQ